MTTISSPALGVGGFPIAKWTLIFGAHSGIIEDFDGTSLTLTKISVGNIARYSTGKIAVGGYVLEVTAAHDLTVSTTAATYYTWACYDPALNVADGSGNADPDGPVTLGISSGLPSTTGSKQYVLLDKIVRTTGQALSASTASRLAPWIGVSATIPDYPPGFTATNLGWTTSLTGNDIYPLGSTLTVLSSGERFHRAFDGDFYTTSGSPCWFAEGVSYTEPLDLRGTLVADTTAPEYWTENGRATVHFRGTIKRPGGNLTNGADVDLADVPAGFRPYVRQRCPVTGHRTDSRWEAVNVTVGTDGVMTLYDPTGFELDLIDISGLTYRTRA